MTTQEIGSHRFTISQELKRNCGRRGYRHRKDHLVGQLSGPGGIRTLDLFSAIEEQVGENAVHYVYYVPKSPYCASISVPELFPDIHRYEARKAIRKLCPEGDLMQMIFMKNIKSSFHSPGLGNPFSMHMDPISRHDQACQITLAGYLRPVE